MDPKHNETQSDINHLVSPRKRRLLIASLSLAFLTGLGVGFLGLIEIANADEWSEMLEDEHIQVAPLIDAYEGLRDRADKEFQELDDYFDERPRPTSRKRELATTHKKSSKRVKKTKRIKKTKRVKHTSAVERSETRDQRDQRDQIAQRKAELQRETGSATAPKRSTRYASQQSEFERSVLRLVNQERARGGNCGGRRFPPSAPLRSQPQLAKAAKQHAVAMAERDFFDHRGPDGDTPRDRINGSGYQGRMWGENIAAGQRKPTTVVRAWMESPGHCRNILNPHFTEIGISFIFGQDSHYKTYWVQAFGTPRK